MNDDRTLRMTGAALMLALALILPFITGNLPRVGNLLLPMHLPVLLCGFLCGWGWGLLTGAAAPLLRSLLFGAPPPIPTALCMAFELATYGAAAGLCYRRLRGKPGGLLLSLAAAMLAGRVVWGLASVPVYALLTEKSFTLAAFWTGGFVNAWPGMLLQLLLVPTLVPALEKAGQTLSRKR